MAALSLVPTAPLNQLEGTMDRKMAWINIHKNMKICWPIHALYHSFHYQYVYLGMNVLFLPRVGSWDRNTSKGSHGIRCFVNLWSICCPILAPNTDYLTIICWKISLSVVITDPFDVSWSISVIKHNSSIGKDNYCDFAEQHYILRGTLNDFIFTRGWQSNEILFLSSKRPQPHSCT